MFIGRAFGWRLNHAGAVCVLPLRGRVCSEEVGVGTRLGRVCLPPPIHPSFPAS